jgi:large conductance mechanosensitive channel
MESAMSLLKEFKEFASRGNVIDLAVGVIIGGAFGTIVKSLVDDVIMPPIGWTVGGIDFSGLSLKLPVQAKDGKPVEILFGKFLNNAISFLIIAFAVFMLVKAMNAIQKKKEEASKATKSEELLADILATLKEKK